jgi:hypothetical protein
LHLIHRVSLEKFGVQMLTWNISNPNINCGRVNTCVRNKVFSFSATGGRGERGERGSVSTNNKMREVIESIMVVTQDTMPCFKNASSTLLVQAGYHTLF